MARVVPSFRQLPLYHPRGLRCAAIIHCLRYEVPDHARDFAGDFREEIIACAPLDGPKFREDARKVHQLLKNFLMVESAEQWI